MRRCEKQHQGEIGCLNPVQRDARSCRSSFFLTACRREAVALLVCPAACCKEAETKGPLLLLYRAHQLYLIGIPSTLTVSIPDPSKILPPPPWSIHLNLPDGKRCMFFGGLSLFVRAPARNILPLMGRRAGVTKGGALPLSAKKTLLRRRRPLGRWACKAPNQRLESSFCSWVAGPRLA